MFITLLMMIDIMTGCAQNETENVEIMISMDDQLCRA